MKVCERPTPGPGSSWRELATNPPALKEDFVVRVPTHGVLPVFVEVEIAAVWPLLSQIQAASGKSCGGAWSPLLEGNPRVLLFDHFSQGCGD